MSAELAYLVFTLFTGTIILVGARIHMTRELDRIKRRDDKFKADIARIRKLSAERTQ